MTQVTKTGPKVPNRKSSTMRPIVVGAGICGIYQMYNPTARREGVESGSREQPRGDLVQEPLSWLASTPKVLTHVYFSKELWQEWD